MFQKGHEKVGGKQKGAKNANTLAWENLGDFFTKEGAERAKGIMQKANDEMYMKYYGMMIDYFKPKLRSMEVKAEIDMNVVTTTYVLDDHTTVEI